MRILTPALACLLALACLRAAPVRLLPDASSAQARLAAPSSREGDKKGDKKGGGDDGGDKGDDDDDDEDFRVA